MNGASPRTRAAWVLAVVLVGSMGLSAGAFAAFGARTCAEHAPGVDPAAIFEADFERRDPLKAFGRVSRAANLAIVADPADEAGSDGTRPGGGNHALRVRIGAGGHYGGSMHVVMSEHLEDEPTKLYLRYRLRLDASWSPEHGGKLPGFNGTYGRAGWGGKPSDGTNGWSARGMFGRLDDSGRTPIGSYIYHADMVDRGQQYGNSEMWDARLERERWYVIEQEIRLDTVRETDGGFEGAADGWLRAWVDGELVFDRRGLHVRDTDDLRIESVWLNVYYGGKSPSPRDMSILIDDVWVGSTRPGSKPDHATTGDDRR